MIQFVQTVSDINSKDYVKPDDRIAAFDNDGTLKDVLLFQQNNLA